MAEILCKSTWRARRKRRNDTLAVVALACLALAMALPLPKNGASAMHMFPPLSYFSSRGSQASCSESKQEPWYIVSHDCEDSPLDMAPVPPTFESSTSVSDDPHQRATKHQRLGSVRGSSAKDDRYCGDWCVVPVKIPTNKLVILPEVDASLPVAHLSQHRHFEANLSNWRVGRPDIAELQWRHAGDPNMAAQMESLDVLRAVLEKRLPLRSLRVAVLMYASDPAGPWTVDVLSLALASFAEQSVGRISVVATLDTPVDSLETSLIPAWPLSQLALVLKKSRVEELEWYFSGPQHAGLMVEALKGVSDEAGSATWPLRQLTLRFDNADNVPPAATVLSVLARTLRSVMQHVPALEVALLVVPDSGTCYALRESMAEFVAARPSIRLLCRTRTTRVIALLPVARNRATTGERAAHFVLDDLADAAKAGFSAEFEKIVAQCTVLRIDAFPLKRPSSGEMMPHDRNCPSTLSLAAAFVESIARAMPRLAALELTAKTPKARNGCATNPETGVSNGVLQRLASSLPSSLRSLTIDNVALTPITLRDVARIVASNQLERLALKGRTLRLLPHNATPNDVEAATSDVLSMYKPLVRALPRASCLRHLVLNLYHTINIGHMEWSPFSKKRTNISPQVYSMIAYATLPDTDFSTKTLSDAVDSSASDDPSVDTISLRE